MKKLLCMCLIGIFLFTTATGVCAKDLNWYEVENRQLMVYDITDEDMMRHFPTLENSMGWSAEDAIQIQDAWFDMMDEETRSNVIVMYQIDANGNAHLLQEPWLAAGRP